MDECPVCGGPMKFIVEVNIHKTFIETGWLDEGTSAQVAFDVCEDCGHKEPVEDDDETDG